MTAKSLHQVLSIGISFRQNASSGPGDLQWGLGLISDEHAAMLFVVVLHGQSGAVLPLTCLSFTGADLGQEAS